MSQKMKRPNSQLPNSQLTKCFMLLKLCRIFDYDKFSRNENKPERGRYGEPKNFPKFVVWIFPRTIAKKTKNFENSIGILKKGRLSFLVKLRQGLRKNMEK